MADLSVDLGKFSLKNPVTTASGTFGYGFEYHQYYDIAQLGAVIVKGIRMTPSHGNPTPRVAEVTGGMLNAIGLQGPGVDKFLHDEHYMPFLRKVGATTIVNIWGTSMAEYGEVAARLEADIRRNFDKLMGNQSRIAAAKAAGRAVDVSADDFKDED